MTTDHVLSADDHEILADTGWKNSRELANYAYNLGVERGKAERREFICARCGIRQDSKPSGESPF